jgi:hypothetical protein
MADDRRMSMSSGFLDGLTMAKSVADLERADVSFNGPTSSSSHVGIRTVRVLSSLTESRSSRERKRHAARCWLALAPFGWAAPGILWSS